MTAMMNDLLGDSLAALPTPAPSLAEGACAPVLTITVNSQAVLTIARRLHDGSCLDGQGCELRDFHALDSHEADVKSMLAALVQAGTGAACPEISTCRSTSDRRWFKGQWWCTTCDSSVRFTAGQGWVHILNDILV